MGVGNSISQVPLKASNIIIDVILSEKQVEVILDFGKRNNQIQIISVECDLLKVECKVVKAWMRYARVETTSILDLYTAIRQELNDDGFPHAG